MEAKNVSKFLNLSKSNSNTNSYNRVLSENLLTSNFSENLLPLNGSTSGNIRETINHFNKIGLVIFENFLFTKAIQTIKKKQKNLK